MSAAPPGPLGELPTFFPVPVDPAGVAAAATGDRGARDYLARHDTALVECGDLASGHDVDSR